MSLKKQRGRTAQDPDELVERAILNGLSQDRSQLDPHPVRRVLGQRSIERYSREYALWEAYERKFPGSTPQDMQTLKHFAEFLGLSKVGRLPQEDGKKSPTVGSIRGAMRRFCNAWEREHHAFISLDVERSMAPVLALRPPKNGNFRVIDWADGAQEKPVFPEWSATGPRAKSKNPTSWGAQFSEWGNRAGFTACLGLHAVRREALIKVNDNGYSLGQVLRFASQNNTNVLVNKYLGNISTIDGAGSYLGMELRSDLAEDFRSASVGRNPDLRFSLPARQAGELRKSPEYLSLTKKIYEINAEIEMATSPEVQTQLELQRKAAYKERWLLENKSLKEFQANQKLVYETDQEEHEQSDWRHNHFNRISHMLPEERSHALGTALFTLGEQISRWKKGCANGPTKTLGNVTSPSVFRRILPIVNAPKPSLVLTRNATLSSRLKKISGRHDYFEEVKANGRHAGHPNEDRAVFPEEDSSGP
ncbi:hypothetical protein CDV31_014729 [Fusarium ambrosium]|uniref:Uncharacterized protein n=1 Tax=Fusarium ambrosium TaxID=131363 RepID=A0A428SUB8_9HYPO|nr:hypothetical protein CDV31_014729 [Fusarium ambrosium]